MSLNRDWKFNKLVKYSSALISNKRLLSHDVVYYLLKALENADPQLSIDIENDLVKIGTRALNELIKALDSSNKKIRSHAAMVLIRIGTDSIGPLQNAYKDKPESQWMIDFIISEIQGSKKSILHDVYINSIAS